MRGITGFAATAAVKPRPRTRPIAACGAVCPSGDIAHTFVLAAAAGLLRRVHQPMGPGAALRVFLAQVFPRGRRAAWHWPTGRGRRSPLRRRLQRVPVTIKTVRRVEIMLAARRNRGLPCPATTRAPSVGRRRIARPGLSIACAPANGVTGACCAGSAAISPLTRWNCAQCYAACPVGATCSGVQSTGRAVVSPALAARARARPGLSATAAPVR